MAVIIWDAQRLRGELLKINFYFQVKAVVVNHGSFTEREQIEALQQPVLINASDKDKQLSREKLAQYQCVLDCKKDLPSDVKVAFQP